MKKKRRKWYAFVPRIQMQKVSGKFNRAIFCLNIKTSWRNKIIISAFKNLHIFRYFIKLVWNLNEFIAAILRIIKGYSNCYHFDLYANIISSHNDFQRRTQKIIKIIQQDFKQNWKLFHEKYIILFQFV